LRTRRSKYKTVSTAADSGVVSMPLRVWPMASATANATSLSLTLTTPARTPTTTDCTMIVRMVIISTTAIVGQNRPFTSWRDRFIACHPRTSSSSRTGAATVHATHR
jgi:hypothetical protein